MGLFDIFRRRSKKNQEQTEKPEEKQPEKQAISQKEAESSDTQSQASQAASSEMVTAESAGSVESAADSAAAGSDQFSTSAADESQQKPVSQVVEPSSVAASETASSVDSSVSHNDVKTDEAADSNEAVVSEVPSEPSQSSEAPADSDTSDSAEVSPASDDQTAAKVVDHADQSKASSSEEPVVSAPSETDEASTQSYEKGLAKSRSTFGQRLNALLANFRHVDESFFDDVEDMLIESDVGFETSMQIADDLREEVKLQNVKKPKDVQNVIVKKLIDMYDAAGTGENPAINMAKSGPTVILFVGVNGVGKTTTIGKMAKMYKDQGKKVILAAADTFRAGAIEQLNVWAQRDGVDIVKGRPKSDPASVVFDAVKKARDENYDILFVDTAGRLQNKVNLMNELSKMKKVITREIPDAPHEVLLVLDATTGQNAMTQAKLFKETTNVTGIVLTKLDGTARGGIVLAIRSELHLPVKYVGLGEKVTDLKPFDPNDFVYGLFKGLISE